MGAIRVLGASVAVLALLGTAASADPATGEQLVDVLNKIFGAHEKMRASHTKGICVKGDFKPTAEAARLSKAPQFAGAVPLVGRYSLGGGNPAAADNQKDNVRAIALHFNLPDGSVSDLLMITAPVFPAKNPDQFLELLTAVASKDKETIGAYFAANPESTRQKKYLMARQVPASYATAEYFGVHTFYLTNKDGQRQAVKWKAVPVGGFKGLDDEAAKDSGADFYHRELEQRLPKEPAAYELFAILGQPGDQDDDPTAEWPADRKSVKMGTITISDFEPAATCDAGVFDPNIVADGIEPSPNDKILPMRTESYAVSFARRQ